ncbi:hypothetical protein ABEY96_15900 [Priestia aryabhattai]|uniref:hypothetical protein n=1 Tax=Priestia aryabhattai TaxID=412384 RepID=UPI003D2DEF6C
MDLNDNYIIILLKEISNLLFSGNLIETLVFAALIRSITKNKTARYFFVLLIIILRMTNSNEDSVRTNDSTNDTAVTSS